MAECFGTDSLTMLSVNPPRAAHENFLKVALTASWFNDVFDYRTVSKWCELTEKQGKLIYDRLVELGLVENQTDGASRVTDAGRLQVRGSA
jgi:hypothetical protein